MSHTKFSQMTGTARKGGYRGKNPHPPPGPQTQPLAEATVKKSKARRAVEKFDSETECILTKGRSRPYCTVCKVDIVDSPKAVKQHLKSKPHKERVEKMD